MQPSMGVSMNERAARDLPWPTRFAQRWFERRTFAGDDLPSARSLAARARADGVRVSVVLPALNEAATIGDICGTVSRRLMEDVPLVDQLLVVDGNSEDGTAAVARAAGAEVVRVTDLMPGVAPVRGKGESLWRSLSVVTGDVVVWIDADIRNFEPHFVTRLVAPLLADSRTSFVKAFYRRPLAHGDDVLASGGGRVTELLARPLLNMLFPELSAMIQPLSGEYAGRREVLERLPFFTGYSVEVGLLIDLLDAVGLEGMAQVDLDERVHRNRPLEELSPMAFAIGRTILRRAEDWGRVEADHDFSTLPLLIPDEQGAITPRAVEELERPPMAKLFARAPSPVSSDLRVRRAPSPMSNSPRDAAVAL